MFTKNTDNSPGRRRCGQRRFGGPAPAIYLESSRWTFEQVTLGQLRALLLDATAMEPRPSRPHGGGSLGRQGCPIPILRLRDLVVGGLWRYILAEGPHNGKKERRGFVARAFPNRGFIAKWPSPLVHGPRMCRPAYTVLCHTAFLSQKIFIFINIYIFIFVIQRITIESMHI